MTNELSGQAVVLIGGSAGIGLATVKHAHAAGVRDIVRGAAIRTFAERVGGAGPDIGHTTDLLAEVRFAKQLHLVR
ncbi:hypothetical protein MHEL_03620 [Mycolicibacterium helvum]|uniref:Short-chain dehydrogenase n=1 Tax=Mycolicibacterium helvum TaxID=1534349 RepID=A0A7I7T0Y5_9MYCO|nr:hypothetical protein MHEL_03620 [Mycolicibacterium helvum]